jgi:peptidoglycan-N-acetylglucosamine deacetylase
MISIVIPAFNEEKMIAESLASLKKQDYSGSYEIIVVDNGSHDGTSDVALSYGVIVVPCEKHGVAFARQAGLMAAAGEIVVQADADTIYPVWWLTRLKRQFDLHPKSIAVAGTFIYKNPPWWACFEYFLRSFFGQLSTWVFGRPYIVSGANLAFQKKALVNAGGYRQEAYSSDQIDITTRLSKIGKVHYDWKSYAFTSNRSVAKPTYRLVFEFLRNLSYFGLHLFQKTNLKQKKQAKKTSSVSTGT